LSKLAGNIADLQSDSVDDRQRAVSRLGETGQIEAVEPLLAALRDDAWNVRAAAATSIGKLYYTSGAVRALSPGKIADALLPLLEAEQPGLRINTVRSLGWIGDARAAAAVRGLLNDEDERVREAVITTLGMLGDTSSAAAFVELLKHEDKWTRHKAANALGNLHSPESFAPLIEALGDTESVVRGGAVMALQELGDPRAAEHVRQLLRDPDPDVRFWAIQAVVAFKDEGSLPILREIAENDTESGNGQPLNQVAEKACESISGKLMSGNPLRGLFDKIGMLFGLSRSPDDKPRKK
jgi:HEAT repeat protein